MCTLALPQSGGCEKMGVKEYPGLGLPNNFSSMVKVCAWESWLNRRETCSPPLHIASIRPNEALIGGVGCCSLEKHGVSKATMKMTTKTEEAVVQMSVSLNCMFSNNFKRALTEYAQNFN